MAGSARLKGCKGWQVGKLQGLSASILLEVTRTYWHLFHTMSLTLLVLWVLEHASIEVRHCRTALPHHPTAVSEESFAVVLHVYAMRAEAGGPAAQGRVSGDATPQRGQSAGAACVGCRVFPIQFDGRVMSHKWVTYFDVSIPSCPGRSGTRPAEAGRGKVPVVHRHPTTAWLALSCQSIDWRALIYAGFMAIYAHLF